MDIDKIRISTKKSLLVLMVFTLVTTLTMATIIYDQRATRSTHSEAAQNKFQEQEGEYIINHKDSLDQTDDASTFETFLKTDEGKNITLRFNQSLPFGVRPHSRIRVRGTTLTPQVFQVAPATIPPTLHQLQREQIQRHFGGNDIQILRPGPSVLGAATPKTIKLAVVLVNFSNLQTQPYNKDQIYKDSFTDPKSLKTYIEENSYGKIKVEGNVFGYYTLDEQESCYPDYYSVANKARLDGVNLDDYQQIIIVSARSEGMFHNPCYGGLSDLYRVAHVGLPDSQLKNAGTWKGYAMHELTHGFGSYHSGSISCKDSAGTRTSISSSCERNGRTDPFDVMGYGSYHLGVVHKLETNFLDQSQVKQVTTSGTYTLEPLEKPSTGIQGLRIAKGTQAYFGPAYYYLEYRQPFGAFDTFSPSSPVVNGVLMHQDSDGSKGASTEIIDTTPNTVLSDPLGLASFKDAALGVGKVFYDPATHIKIETVSVSPQNATVKITLNAASVGTGTGVGVGVNSSPTPLPSPQSTKAQTPTKAPTPTPTIPVPTPTSTFRPFPWVTIRVSAPIPPAVSNSDRTPPTTPILRNYGPFLVWSRSWDNVAVGGYYVIRNNVRVATMSANSSYFLDTQIQPNSLYYYTIQAFDTNGNLSNFSNTVTINLPRY